MESVSNDVQEMLTVRTAGYRPPMQYRPSSLSRGLPPFTISVIEWMRRDSQIKLGMCIKAAPFHKVKLTIKGDPEVVKFMSENIRRFWTKAIPKVIRGFWYTICGGEIQHKINPVTGRQEFWNLYDVYPLDLRILHQNRVPCGVSVRPNGWVQEGSVDGVDPMDSKPIRLFFPKGFLYIHGREFNSLIGISDFEAAYDPWLEKNDWQGAKHSRKLWFYKNAFSGGILLHPPGNYETENNVMIPYRDLARQAMETSLNGAVWCLENKPDPATGQQQWQYIEPKINGGGAELINYVHELDNEMLRGLSIPDDVVTQVSGGGSFAGRTIPLMAFLISQESTLNNLFTVCDEQVFRPICKTNFGHDNYEASMAIDIDRIMGVMNAGEVGDSGDANANPDENDQMEAGGKIVSSEPTQFSDDGINNLIDVMEGKPFTVRVVQDMEGKGTVRYSGIKAHPGTDVFQFGTKAFNEADHKRGHGPTERFPKGNKGQFVRVVKDSNLKYAEHPTYKVLPDHLQKLVKANWRSVQVNTHPEAEHSLKGIDKDGNEVLVPNPLLKKKGAGTDYEKQGFIAAERQGKGKDAKIVIRGKGDVSHILPSMVPPAWKNVLINPDPNGRIYVKARDAHGNVKTVMNPKFEGGQVENKFKRVSALHKQFDSIMKQVMQDRNGPNKEEADCLWLISEQATRPGGEVEKIASGLLDRPMTKKNVEIGTDSKGKPKVTIVYPGQKPFVIKDEGTREALIKAHAENKLEDSNYWLKAYGATTLEARHIIVSGKKVSLKFIGKEAVAHNHEIKNPELAAMLAERKFQASSPTDKIFGTNDSRLLKYTKSLGTGGFLNKDFRSLKATRIATAEIKKLGMKCPPEKFDEWQMKVATVASKLLGNRPEQAKESYIDPAVWIPWQS